MGKGGRLGGLVRWLGLWLSSSVALGVLLSLFSALTLQNRDCGSLPFGALPCGLLAGWPVGFAEFELNGKSIIVSSDTLLFALPPLQGVGYHYGEFYLSLFTINTVVWVLLVGAAALILSVTRALYGHLARRRTRPR